MSSGARSTAHRTKNSSTAVDIGGVLQTGRELAVREALPLPNFAAFRFPLPVDVALTIRRAGGGLELKGTVDGRVAGECARCLEPVELPLHLELEERFDPALGAADPFGENNVLHGDELDVADLIRQLIDSALPLTLACSETCPGLCPECGRKRDGTSRCPHPE